MKIKIALTGIIILAFFATSRAQVTIGSNVPPRSGVLLDLKQDASTDNNPNSKNGLGLPRVALTALTTLTVDDNSKSNDYVGLTVYNTTTNSELSPGTYCWFSNTWNQVVIVNDSGTDGNILKSNGDNTYDWTTIVIPEYKFWKPTQKAFFDTNKGAAGRFTYNYEDVAPNEGNIPKADLFKNRFVYSDVLKISSAATTGKFLLVEITANVTKKTSDNQPAIWSFLEEIQVDIVIGNMDVKSYIRSVANPINTVTNNIVDLFSVVPLDEFQLGQGEYSIQVRISCKSHTYPRNGSTANPVGNFPSSGPFLTIEATNFGFILYEEE